ncbi:MAG: 16S rRNA (cytosine(967)-C(5))-methyltransferase RsmB [Acidaminococcaceae bacterium]|nr:16S rRNA (cytosine(967)-C(5))-methyltransferase RsmB [Acidaminococcaceae bacterium]
MQGTAKRIVPANGREAALLVLLQIWEEGAYTAIALNRVLRQAKLEEQDRRFATELVNGAVKARGTLDFILGQMVDRPLQKLEPVIRHILHLGLFQIFYLDRIPDSAACNESVNLSKKFSHKGTDKFVNGVLRNSIRQKVALCERIQEDVSLRLSHPRWLVERWRKQFGEEETEALCRWDNEPASLCLRVNTLMTARDAFLQDLREFGCEGEVSLWCPDGIVITRSPGLPALLQTFPHSFYVQDESSMLPAMLLHPKAGEQILDMCAAPGGKTTHIAALMENKGRVTACDIYPHKLKLIEENAKRLKLDNIKTEIQDGTVLREEWTGKFDRVLVDAPCSGLGVLRRRAEARWTKREKDLREFPVLQQRILENASRYVKTGGFLVYSTCTLEENENGKQIDNFLQNHREWKQAGFVHPRSKEMVKELQLYPQRDGVDGFYLTLLQKE